MKKTRLLKLATLVSLSLPMVAVCGETSTNSKKSPNARAAQASASKGDVISANQAKDFYTVVILHNGDDTGKLSRALKPLVEGTKKCALITAKVDDATLKPLFKELKLDPETVPTPLAIAIAPNSVITGVFMQAPAEKAFKEAILPKQPLSVIKALMTGKSVIVTMQSSKTLGNKETNIAIAAYLADPKKKGKYVSVLVELDKPENAGFLKQLKIDPTKETKSVILGMAPPLKIVSKPFRGLAKKSDIDKAVNPACATGCAPGG